MEAIGDRTVGRAPGAEFFVRNGISQSTHETLEVFRICKPPLARVFWCSQSPAVKWFFMIVIDLGSANTELECDVICGSRRKSLPLRKWASGALAANALVLLTCAEGCLQSDPGPKVGTGTFEANLNFPWVMQIDGDCQGALIAPRWVLTAAHCMVGDKFVGAHVFYTRTNSTGITTTGDQYTASAADPNGASVFIHPQYNAVTAENDIALVKLPAPFPDDPLVRPVELPTFSVLIGTQGFIASVISHTGGLPAGDDAVYHGTIEQRDATILVHHSSTSAICSGDSGSGMIVQVGGQNYLIGITSQSSVGGPLGEEPCLEGPHDIATSTAVDGFLDWIRNTIRGATPVPLPAQRGTDILWRNLDGTPAFWQRASAGAEMLLGALDGNWQIQGVGDFDGNGESDILWRCVPVAPATACGDAVAGAIAIWTFSQGGYSGTTWPGALDFNWQIQGVGDFDGNGDSDILWRCVPKSPGTACGSAAAGTAAIWQFANGNYSTTTWPGAVDFSWQISGVGDFDGNHKSDILWRNSDGSNSIWYDGNSATSVWPPALDVNWQIQGIGDFDGNGNSDILWRCIPQPGATACGAAPAGSIAFWLFSGGRYATTTFPGVLDFNWQIQGVGDFDSNGDSDIIWRCSPHGGNACGNAAVGSVAIWEFSDGNYSGTTWSGALDTNWQIQGVGRF